MQYLSYSEYETKQIAKKLAKDKRGHIFALSGELGAGKTIFAQGFAKGLGIKNKIISPTFVLIRQHQLPNKKGVLFHVDLYRLENTEGIQNIGLEEIWSDPNNIVLIEWAEKIEKMLPKNAIRIQIVKKGDRSRIITVS